MKSKLLVGKMLVLVALAVLFVGCKKGESKSKGPGKEHLSKLIDAYSQANAILTDDVSKKDKEIEMLKADLEKMNAQGLVDEDTINKIKTLVAGTPGVGSDFSMDPKGIALDSDVTFASGSEVLSARGHSNLKKLVDTGFAKEGIIVIEGHTDSDPISKTKNKHSSNFELSAKRAAHVAEQLIALGVPGDRIIVQGCGEFNPLPGKSKKEQRRIVFRKVSK